LLQRCVRQEPGAEPSPLTSWAELLFCGRGLRVSSMPLDKASGGLHSRLVGDGRFFGRCHDLGLIPFRKADGASRFRRLRRRDCGASARWDVGLRVIHAAPPFSLIRVRSRPPARTPNPNHAETCSGGERERIHSPHCLIVPATGPLPQGQARHLRHSRPFADNPFALTG